MLNASLGWCGKVPIHPDFIQSTQLKDVQKCLMDWLVKGQDHIGEQFIKSDIDFTLYYFFVECSISDHKRIHGIFLSSHDSRGRACPFLMFTHDHHMQPVQAIDLFDRQLAELGLSWKTFSTALSDSFMQQLKMSLESLDVLEMFQGDMDRWIELYPEMFKSNFKIESTNHVIYRKLLIR